MRAERREGDETLDRAMEYTGAVGVELVDMLVSINTRVPDQYMFSGNGDLLPYSLAPNPLALYTTNTSNSIPIAH